MVESIVGKTLNKGEWAEFYVMLKLLGEGKLYTADNMLKKKLDSYLDVLKIIRQEFETQVLEYIVDQDNAIQNMLNAIQQGILTPSTKERLEALEQEREEIKVAIYSEELQKPKITKEHIAFWISKFRDTNLTDVASRKRLVESFVNAVFVYDDKVVFTFNYKDGSKTATIDEINAELGSDLEGISPPTP